MEIDRLLIRRNRIMRLGRQMLKEGNYLKAVQAQRITSLIDHAIYQRTNLARRHMPVATEAA